ncbi:MAG: hypothetical protein LBP87_01500 [Planctomycetaceae bacterium]|nr:hypothetical protein [Planctomycetaceae bacterium]
MKKSLLRLSYLSYRKTHVNFLISIFAGYLCMTDFADSSGYDGQFKENPAETGENRSTAKQIIWAD